jgi:hypothetical protein
MMHMLVRFFPGFLGSLSPLVLFLTFPALSVAQNLSTDAIHVQTAVAGHPTAVVPRENTLSASETPRERTEIAGRFATERLAVWQKRLALEDWNISVVVARASELKPRTLGNIHWDSDKKTAVIRVLDPADYKMPYDAMLKDIEFTVVHELIHLELSPVLSPLQRNDANRREEEHAVNHMADALLQLDRSR